MIFPHLKHIQLVWRSAETRNETHLVPPGLWAVSQMTFRDQSVSSTFGSYYTNFWHYLPVLANLSQGRTRAKESNDPMVIQRLWTGLDGLLDLNKIFSGLWSEHNTTVDDIVSLDEDRSNVTKQAAASWGPLWFSKSDSPDILQLHLFFMNIRENV